LHDALDRITDSSLTRLEELEQPKESAVSTHGVHFPLRDYPHRLTISTRIMKVMLTKSGKEVMMAMKRYRPDSKHNNNLHDRLLHFHISGV
jgi:hypothetical protein